MLCWSRRIIQGIHMKALQMVKHDETAIEQNLKRI